MSEDQRETVYKSPQYSEESNPLKFAAPEKQMNYATMRLSSEYIILTNRRKDGIKKVPKERWDIEIFEKLKNAPFYTQLMELKEGFIRIEDMKEPTKIPLDILTQFHNPFTQNLLIDLARMRLPLTQQPQLFDQFEHEVKQIYAIIRRFLGFGNPERKLSKIQKEMLAELAPSKIFEWILAEETRKPLSVKPQRPIQ